MDIQTFAQIAAHDLKAPMSSIASLVEFLDEDYGAVIGDAGREDLAMLKRLATRGVALVDGLKLYARVASVDLRMAPVDMNVAASRALEAVAARTETPVLTPGLTTPLATAWADATLIGVLLEQLVHNAVTFRRPDAGCHLEVGQTDATVPPGPANHTVYYIRDNGPGIAPGRLDEIFQLFRRLHGTDAFGGGAGSGLAICRQIVERHGGRIWAESAGGHGSTFYFTLPAPGGTA